MADSEIKSSKPILSTREQLSTLYGIKGCIDGGDTLTAIASKFEGLAKESEERSCWAKIKADLESDQNVNIVIAKSGLFTPEVGRIFSVIVDTKNAAVAAIEYLAAIVH